MQLDTNNIIFSKPELQLLRKCACKPKDDETLAGILIAVASDSLRCWATDTFVSVMAETRGSFGLGNHRWWLQRSAVDTMIQNLGKDDLARLAIEPDGLERFTVLRKVKGQESLQEGQIVVIEQPGLEDDRMSFPANEITANTVPCDTLPTTTLVTISPTLLARVGLLEAATGCGSCQLHYTSPGNALAITAGCDGCTVWTVLVPTEEE